MPHASQPECTGAPDETPARRQRSNNPLIYLTAPLRHPVPKGTDVLIGMDIVNTGDFLITSEDGNTKFMFQLPSRWYVERVLEESEDWD